MTPEVAFEILKTLNPSITRIYHPGSAGEMPNERGLYRRVFAYPHMVYFMFESEIDWPEGITHYPDEEFGA